MSVWYGYVLAALWLGWAAYWAITSVGGKPVARSESWQSRLGYSVPLWIAAVLLLSRHMPYPLGGRILPVANCTASVGVILTAAGLGFAIWARIHLGTNWSADVTVKEGHELVRSGPYALARHPIYTGLTLAFLGTAIVIGEWRAVIAMAIAVASFWYKLTLEERVMTQTFGREYDDYKRQVKALIPFVI